MKIFGTSLRRSLAVAATIAVTAFSSVAFTAPAEARDSDRGHRYERHDRDGRWDRGGRHDRWDHRRDYRRDHRHHRHHNHYRPRYYSSYYAQPYYYYPQPGFSFYYGY
jgi:hypothetical protein